MSQRDTLFTLHRTVMSRWAVATLPALTIIIGLTILHASPPQTGQANPKSKLSKAEKLRQKAMREEMEDFDRKWPSEEVPYIITDQEQAAYESLSNDNDREEFIENFWERRNHNSGSPKIEYKEEYYQRIIYTNERFGCYIPGWKTDRGRIYIKYGPPDLIDAHPSGGAYEPPRSEGGPEAVTYPFDQWHYQKIDGIGEDVILTFDDSNMTGEYGLVVAPARRDALLQVPAAGLTTADQDWNDPHGGAFYPGMTGVITRLDLFTTVVLLPQAKFQELNAMVTDKISAHLLPFDAHTNFIRATAQSTLTPITVQIADSDLQFQKKDGVRHGVLHLYGRVTNLAGRIVNTFAKSLVLNVPEREFEHYQTHKTTYQEAIPLRPGQYKVNLVLQDDSNGHMGSKALAIDVPSFSEDKLSHSSLILANQIQPLPDNVVWFGPFVIGTTRVRPSVNNIFLRDQLLGIYMQVYDLGIDEKTHKPSLDVRYVIEKDGTPVIHQAEDASRLSKATQQFTVAKMMGLREYAPGKYTVRIKVTDNIRKQTINPSATFEVR